MNQDPVLPVGSLILGWLLTFVVVAILATALVLLVRDRELSAMAKLGWAIAVVLVPIVGPAAYLITSLITRLNRRGAEKVVTD